MNKHHSGNNIYVASKHRLETVFGIRHFAGVVYYDSTGTEGRAPGDAGRLKAPAVNASLRLSPDKGSWRRTETPSAATSFGCWKFPKISSFMRCFKARR